MCCIFTWMAWCFDASHRVVVFIMACCISSSVCCLLLTASLAGVAMGYNYSLAEYIDLKETNISVYIKRGVYDDEIGDDFDWRRAGGGEPSISLRDNTGQKITPDYRDSDQPLGDSRRRMGSIMGSDEFRNYEGSLMRLTSKAAGQADRRFDPPAPPYTTPTSTTSNAVDRLLQFADDLPGGSKERLRVIQAAARQHEINKIELATAEIPEDPSDRVKAIEANAQIHSARRTEPTTTTDKYAKYFAQLAQHPGFPGSGLSARKFMQSPDKDAIETPQPNRFRDAVFGGQLRNWPTPDPSKSTAENFFDYEETHKPPLLTPPTVQPLLVRPLENKKQIMWDKPKVESPIKINKPNFKEYGDNKYDTVISKDMARRGQWANDYDEAHGLPVRRKRSGSKVSLKDSEALEEELEVSTNTERALVTDFIQKSTAKSTTTELDQNTLNSTNNNSSNTSQAKPLETGHNDSGDSVKISKVNSLEHLASWKTKSVNWKPKKRKKKSEGYVYKILGNKQIESFWWRFSDGVSEQWNRMILYLNKRNSPILDRSRNPKTLYNKDSNSFDNKKSTIINKLVAISTKKPVERNQFDITETNTVTNLDI
ncbi:uncharacterized protein LOC134670087 [Cydia fagiglandana]|uniref:uncharacterized protein LOC134670087 n=1 Tax=Cydia fagiglandana TaxID=1458189 RepID=UPI002FEE0672